jgi:ABC-type antimicrobial peptide transport system permease subunit
VYLLTGPEVAMTTLTLRVHGDPDQARAALFERLATVDPVIDEIQTLRTMAGIDTFLLRVAFWVTIVLAAVALAMTLSGLFSVLSFLVEQRTKEIGVRMALGATTRNVTWLVLSQLLRQVGLGLLAGSGLAVALVIVLLSTPAATYLTGVRVFDPVAYVASVLCILGACMLAGWVPAQRAARIDPIATLRQD